MLKEIHEQPKAVQDTIGAYVHEGAIDFSETGLSDEIFAGLKRVYIVACGFSIPCGNCGQICDGESSGNPVEVDLASEFRYRDPILEPDSLVVVISQSGETADSLAALRLAKEKGHPVLGVVNVVGSSIARESDYILYTYAGPEISVATTKAYSTQLIAMYLLAVRRQKSKERLTTNVMRGFWRRWEHSRKRYRRHSTTKRGSSGLQANMQMQKIFSSLAEVSTMRSVWRAVSR